MNIIIDILQVNAFNTKKKKKWKRIKYNENNN